MAKTPLGYYLTRRQEAKELLFAVDTYRFDFRLFEAQEQLGGNAITVEMPQDNGGSIPFDDPAARRSFNYYGSLMYGWRFKKAKR